MAVKHKDDTTVETPKAKAPEKVEYLSKFTVYHPFQKKRIEPGVPTALEYDGWVEAQLEAGILIKA